MLGKSSWFARRKYGGWGITPKTWQGWVYLAVVIIPFVIVQSLPMIGTELRVYITLGWLIFLFLDVSHIMITLHRDEREHKIEALAERNAAWAMVFIAMLGVLYQLFQTVYAREIQMDWFLVAVLFGGLIVKTISNIVLGKKSL